ncbi:MAG: hypothetical protein ACRDJH_22945 [Thermomicrobiales bacterium]
MKTRPWREIRDKLREDPDMEARIDEYTREMDEVLRAEDTRNQRDIERSHLDDPDPDAMTKD